MKNDKVFVCFACGKRSLDQYGDEALNYVWDISCAINCKEVPTTWLTIDPETNLVTKIEDPSTVGK